MHSIKAKLETPFKIHPVRNICNQTSLLCVQKLFPNRLVFNSAICFIVGTKASVKYCTLAHREICLLFMGFKMISKVFFKKNQKPQINMDRRSGVITSRDLTLCLFPMVVRHTGIPDVYCRLASAIYRIKQKKKSNHKMQSFYAPSNMHLIVVSHLSMYIRYYLHRYITLKILTTI